MPFLAFSYGSEKLVILSVHFFFSPASIIFNGCFKFPFYNALRATHTRKKKQNKTQKTFRKWAINGEKD